eukprot:scaffold8605_cov178-Amphora_coffeaeformis.AAC.2
MDAFSSFNNNKQPSRLTDENGFPCSPLHARQAVNHEEQEEAPDDLVDIDLEADGMLNTNLHVLSPVGTEEDEVSVSSLALIRQVVRSLRIIPPSARVNSLSPRHPVPPSKLFSSEGECVFFSDSQNYFPEEEESPRHKLFSSTLKTPGQLIMEDIDLSFDDGQDPVSIHSPKKTPSLPDTESTSSETSSNAEDTQKFAVPPELQEFHFRWWGHGLWWTVVGIVSALIGSILAVLSRQSTEFAVLAKPMQIAPIYEDVNALGMLKFVVCYNETMSSIDQTGCQTFELTSENVDDRMFELSRCLLTLSAFLGVFFTIFLATACFWESINMKPVGVGFLLVYFMQAFSMLFFDTIVCQTFKCEMGIGCIQCVIASGFWILTCIAVAKMDTHKARLRRRRKRRAKRAIAKAERLATKTKESSEASTEPSNGSVDEELLNVV